MLDAAAPALHTRNLVKVYGEVRAVDGVDLTVPRGECFGLLGPNGAGKTTTIEILEGLTRHDDGEVRVLGGAPSSRDVKARIGIALQETQLPDKLTVFETVRLFRSFYKEGRDPDEVITSLELDEKRDARVGGLSGGQRQRLALACALAGDPDLLFLDEPTTGLDPQARLKVWDIVLAFKAGGGTVLITTHYMEEAARLCDRIGVLDHGRVIALGTPKELIALLGAPQVLEIETEPDLGDDALRALPGVARTGRRGHARVLHVEDAPTTLPSLLALTQERDVAVKQLVTRDATLEDVFVHLTGAELRRE